MISQTETSSHQYGFYAVPKKLQPKKKYRQSQSEQFQELPIEQENSFEPINKKPFPQSQIERDFYVDEAPFPEFKPKPRGLDYGVQVQKGDLFDFDLEVQPLLQIIVGRSVVSAINELQEEKQKIQKRQKLEAYQKKRNAELMMTQRLQAKSKRKQQQSERRILQKEIFVKNQKELGKKLIARKISKKNLLGLRNQVISQLQDAGYLRSQPDFDIRISFEGWLYHQITSLIREEKEAISSVQNIVREVQNQKEEEHRKNIQNQKRRRQEILDERQRIRKQNELRKQKKRIKKQRLLLSSQRQPNAVKFEELLQKYTELESVMKFQNRSNGFAHSGINQVHVSGGLLNFIIVILNSQSKSDYSSDEIQELLTKIIHESSAPLEFQFQEDQYNLILSQIQYMNENANEFMKSKHQKVTELLKKISLSLKLLQLTNINIKSELHDALVQAVLNIVLTTTSIAKGQEQTEVVQYLPTQKDKQRQELKKKIQITQFNDLSLRSLSTILRVRFERKEPSEQQKKSHPQKESEDQWVDIYDGQGWAKHLKQYPEQVPREEQKPVAINIQSFQKIFIYDERVLYFLKKELEKILESESEQDIDRYCNSLANLCASLKINVPVYDAELRITE